MSTPTEPAPQSFAPSEPLPPLLIIRLVGPLSRVGNLPVAAQAAAALIYRELDPHSAGQEFVIRKNRAGAAGYGSEEWFLDQTKHIRDHILHKTREVRFITWDGRKEKESSVAMPLTFNPHAPGTNLNLPTQ